MPALATGVGAEGQGQEGELSVLHVCCWSGLESWSVEEEICCEVSETKVIQKRPVACWKSEYRERM